MSKDHNIYTPPEGPPPADPHNAEIYALMGEEKIFQLIEDFYFELEQSSIRSMFPADMKAAAHKSATFFVFLLGGPPLYQQKHGAPMMRKRHLAFQIDEEARQVWLECFRKTLIDADKKYNFPMDHLEGFWTFLEKFSRWMVNTK